MRKGKIKHLLKKVTFNSIIIVGKLPIFSNFGLEIFDGGTHTMAREYSFLQPP